jgi:hypothetical protein
MATNLKFIVKDQMMFKYTHALRFCKVKISIFTVSMDLFDFKIEVFLNLKMEKVNESSNEFMRPSRIRGSNNTK